jgi:integrase
MFLSKRSNGYYYIFYSNHFGNKTCISTKTKIKSEALKFLSNFKEEINSRQSSKVIPIDLKSFLFEYLKHSEVIHSLNTTKSIRSTTNALSAYFGNIQLYDLTKQKISEYISHRIKQASVYVGKRETAYLSGIFNYAISKHYLNENLAKGNHKIKLPEKQPLFFSEIDFEILLRLIDNPDIKDLVNFAVNTGLRQMELLTLSWNQINFKDKLLILDNLQHITKSKKIRTIPLNIKAMQILTKRELNKTGNIIFTINSEAIKQDFISKKFRKYVKKTGLNPKLSFHSLRHTFASWLIQRGVSIYSVSKLLGHSNIRVTEIYAHLRQSDLMDSVNILNN